MSYRFIPLPSDAPTVRRIEKLTFRQWRLVKRFTIARVACLAVILTATVFGGAGGALAAVFSLAVVAVWTRKSRNRREMRIAETSHNYHPYS